VSPSYAGAEVVYGPESPLREPGALWRAIGRDLRAARPLAWRLLVRNLRAQYRQSALGYFWAILPPLVSTLTWMFLNRIGVLAVGDTAVPYPVFVLAGTVLWQGLADATSGPLSQLTANSALLTKVNFPREAFVLVAVGELLFNFAIRLALLLAVLLWAGVALGPSILLVPLAVASLIVLGTAVGVLLAPFGMLYQDVPRGLTLVLTLWFFVTPVVYPVPDGPLATLLVWNPATPLIVTARDWLTTGTTAMPLAFTAVSLAAVALLGVALVVYRLAMPHLVARLAAR
jgi:lipopolysaccharide transport system permease protein